MLLETSEGDVYSLINIGKTTICKTRLNEWAVFISVMDFFKGWMDIQAGVYSDYEQATAAANQLENFWFNELNSDEGDNFFCMPKNKDGLSTKETE